MDKKTDKVNIPVQLVSVFSTLGDITPRWFRYEEEDHGIVKVDISEIVSVKEINFVGIKMLQYLCKAKINEQNRMFELRYEITTHRWTFYQMIY